MLLTTLLGNADLTQMEKPFRVFDNLYSKLFDTPVKCEDLAFWFSLSTSDYTNNAVERFLNPLAHLMESAIVSGFTCGMVFEWDTLDELLKHPVIVLPCVGMISDEAFYNLRKYSDKGGKILIIGEFAKYHEDGSVRVDSDLVGYLSDLNAVYLPDYIDGTIQQDAWSERKNTRNPLPAAAPACMVSYLRKSGGKLLKQYLTPCVQSSVEDAIPALYKTRTSHTLHLINVSDTIAQEGTMISHFDEIKNFMMNAEKLPGFTVRINTARTGSFTLATLYSPEQKMPIPLLLTTDGEYQVLSIPSEVFSGYAAIDLQ